MSHPTDISTNFTRSLDAIKEASNEIRKDSDRSRVVAILIDDLIEFANRLDNNRLENSLDYYIAVLMDSTLQALEEEKKLLKELSDYENQVDALQEELWEARKGINK